MSDLQSGWAYATWGNICQTRQDLLTGELVELLEQICSFLEAAFSTTLINADRKKQIAQIGILDCDKIRCQSYIPC